MNIVSAAYRARRIAGLSAVALLAVLAFPFLLATPAAAEDAGFWYGADSAGPAPANSSGPPYYEPSCGSGHFYGGYIGEIGSAELVSSSNPEGYGPGNTNAWNRTNAVAANANYFDLGKGVGAGGYWFMTGPNDPNAAGLTPFMWGYQQAIWALDDWSRWTGTGNRLPLRVLWADVEGLTGQNGWGTDYAANRSVYEGFKSEVAAGNFPLGIYSTQFQWDTEIMNGHSDVDNVREWTAQISRSDQPTPCPDNLHPSDTFNAVYFGGQTESSSTAVMWQWSQGSADYDQIDGNRLAGL